MATLYVTYRESSTGGEPLSDDEWCSYAPTYVEFEIGRVSLATPSETTYYDAVKTTDKFSVGDTCYVVVVRYQTGSAFGTTYGRGKILNVVKTHDDAVRMIKLIETGAHAESHIWTDCLESLESAEAHPMVVQSNVADRDKCSLARIMVRSIIKRVFNTLGR